MAFKLQWADFDLEKQTNCLNLPEIKWKAVIIGNSITLNACILFDVEHDSLNESKFSLTSSAFVKNARYSTIKEYCIWV